MRIRWLDLVKPVELSWWFLPLEACPWCPGRQVWTITLTARHADCSLTRQHHWSRHKRWSFHQGAHYPGTSQYSFAKRILVLDSIISFDQAALRFTSQRHGSFLFSPQRWSRASLRRRLQRPGRLQTHPRLWQTWYHQADYRHNVRSHL